MQTANERRAEIIRILSAKRSVTMAELADEFGVTSRTIQNDITILTANYPLETVRGNGGGVKIADGYYPYKQFLTKQQQTAIIHALDKINEQDQKVLIEMLYAYGSQDTKKILLKMQEE